MGSSNAAVVPSHLYRLRSFGLRQVGCMTDLAPKHADEKPHNDRVDDTDDGEAEYQNVVLLAFGDLGKPTPEQDL